VKLDLPEAIGSMNVETEGNVLKVEYELRFPVQLWYRQRCNGVASQKANPYVTLQRGKSGIEIPIQPMQDADPNHPVTLALRVYHLGGSGTHLAEGEIPFSLSENEQTREHRERINEEWLLRPAQEQW
jgi:hypothetical protein